MDCCSTHLKIKTQSWNQKGLYWTKEMTHDIRDVCTELHTKQKWEEIANRGGLKILRPLLILNLKLINFNFKNSEFLSTAKAKSCLSVTWEEDRQALTPGPLIFLKQQLLLSERRGGR